MFRKSLLFQLVLLLPIVLTAGPDRDEGHRDGGQLKKGNIKVEVSGLKNDHGSVLLMLYDSRYQFPEVTDGRAPLRAKIVGGVAKFKIPDLDIGEYAIAVVHDENSNESLDTNIVGIPREGYGFSGPDRGRFARPDYERSKFRLMEDGLEMTIRVHYIFN